MILDSVVCINNKVRCAQTTKTRWETMDELKAWSSVTAGWQRVIGSRRNISGRNISLKGLTGRETLSIILLQKVPPTMQSSITCFCSVVLIHCVAQHTFVLIWENSLKHHSTVINISSFSPRIHVRSWNGSANVRAPSKTNWHSLKSWCKHTLILF